jgi:hypothetical protein
MALLNAVQAGTYTIVRVKNHDVHTKKIMFEAEIYTDSSKSQMITSLVYQLTVLPEKDALPDLGVDTLPTNPTPGDSYWIGPNPTGNAADFKHGQKVGWVVHNGGEWWVKTQLVDKCHYYIQSIDEYCKWLEDPIEEAGGEFVIIPAYFSEAVWTTLFSVAAISMAGNNITQACYDYLKLTPEFENCLDG